MTMTQTEGAERLGVSYRHPERGEFMKRAIVIGATGTIGSAIVRLLSALMWRGAQAMSELRTLTGRMETFEDLGEVKAVMDGF